MTFNEDTSFIEYNVEQPTQDFVTNFDTIGGTTDVVLVTVDGVLTDTPESSYTVQQINHTTWRVTPEVQTGSVVRLYRVTNIDEMMHVFTAGAKFIARNMDSNFKQIRHAQQEVRDAFDFFEYNTLGVVESAKDAAALANTAAQGADDAADTAVQIANDAAAQVDDKIAELQPAIDSKLQEFDQAINTIVVEDGVPALAVVDASGQTQQEINDKQSVLNTGLESIAEMIALSNPQDGMRVYVKSYHENGNTGGGQFICVQSPALTEDLGVVFRSSAVGYEDYFWVRINFDVLTPEMCGANDTLQDSTDAIERFLKLCGQGYKGQAVSGKVYKTNKTISVKYTTSVNIDFNGASIKPFFNLVAGGSSKDTIRYAHTSGDFAEGVTVEINNLFIDLTDFTPVVSTGQTDRQGVRGLVIDHPETISINNYKCKGSFFGSGLNLQRYRYANLENINLPDCGMKINPTKDDTSPYDSAGDAIFLLDIIGHGQTTIKNLYAKSQDGYLGRIGIVTEQFSGRTDSHLVTLENAHFDGYSRVIHQEDGGKSQLIWNGGSAKRFANLCFNLFGVANKNYFDLNAVDIEVDPPFAFGGTSGIACFQNAGDLYLNDCNIHYKKSASERGNKFVRGGTITIDSNVTVFANVSTKTHTLTDVELISKGGYLLFSSGNKGVTVNGGTITGVAGTLTRVIHSANNLIKIGGNCKIVDASVSGENTPTIDRDKNILSDVEIVYTGATSATLFSASYRTAFKLNNVNIKSANAKLTLSGENVRYSINASEFVNVAIQSVNATTTNVNGICKIKGSELYYNDSYGQTNPFTVSSGSLVAVLSGNTFFDATTAQNIALPAESATFKYAAAGNVMRKTAGMTVL